MAVGDEAHADEGATLDPEEWTLRDEEVRTYVRRATAGVESLVRSTLGPWGMEKLIRTRDHQGEPELVQTADASEILDALERGGGVTHPVSALFIDCVDSMQRGLGDGATTAVVLAAALIERGLDLVEEGVHPASVVVGYAMAANRTGEVLDELAREVSADEADTLEEVAAASMTVSDLADDVRRRYAEQVVEAVRGLAEASESGWLNTEDVKVLARAGVEGRLHRGVVVRRWPTALEESERSVSEFDWELSFPEPAEDVTVALVDRELDFERTASSLSTHGHTGVRVSPDRMGEYAEALERRVAETADRLAGLGVDVLVSQEAVDDDVRAAFERAGIVVIDGVKYPLADVHRLARATGGTVEGELDDVTADSLGTAGSVVERRVGDEKWTVFDGCEGGVFTVVADAKAEVAAAQRERVVEDAIEVAAMAAMDRQVLPGAGAAATAAAMDLREYATTVPDRGQLAVEAFADALEAIPRALATNAGHDPIDALTALRAAHAGAGAAPAPIGLDAATGEPVDAWEAGVVEPRRVFSQAVETARAAAEQLLTVDAVLFPGVDFETYELLTEHD